jgi:hypothetical protein
MRRRGMPSRGAIKIRQTRIDKLPVVMTAYGAARACNVHYTTIQQWLDDGLPRTKTGNTPRSPLQITRADLIAFLQATDRISSGKGTFDPFPGAPSQGEADAQ